MKDSFQREIKLGDRVLYKNTLPYSYTYGEVVELHEYGPEKAKKFGLSTVDSVTVKPIKSTKNDWAFAKGNKIAKVYACNVVIMPFELPESPSQPPVPSSTETSAD